MPYDWTLHFLVNLVEQELLAIDGKFHFVLDGLADYFLRDGEYRRRTSGIRTEGTPWSSINQGDGLPRFLTGTNGLTKRLCSSHHNLELTWLEILVEVVAPLLERYPRAARSARNSAEAAERSVLAKELGKGLDLQIQI